MRHVLAIDEGTTGATCLMIGEDGRVAGRGYREIPQYFPQPGWVEHDAMEILDCVLGAARDAIAEAGAAPVAIGITNQRETVVIWERATGKPVHRAIVWQDRRTAARCQELASRADWITHRTGLIPDAYFSATKLEWLLRERSLLYRYDCAELAAGTIDTWLVWQLTGGTVHATDPTNASRTMLYDIDRLEWSRELCDLFGVPMEILPEVRRSSGSFGTAAAAHFGSEIPILGIAGDQQAALFGQGCCTRGTGKNTYGTGAFLLLNAGHERPIGGRGLLTTVACDETGGPAYALEAAIFIAGAAVQWLRDGLGIIDKAGDAEALARSIESTGGVYFVPALTGLGAPTWEPDARGTIVGLTRGSGRAHLVRAALEAMSYGTAEVLESMREASGASFDRLRVDGGATVNDWLMQFQADVLGVPIERPDMVETTALGAAGLAGLAAGVWPDVDAFLATRRFTTFTPSMSREKIGELTRGWQRAVRATVAWAQDGRRAIMTELSTRLDAHCGVLKGCRACGHPAGITPILSAARAPRAMLVGQAPGKVEAAGGRPFAGRAGKTLFRWLERAGIDEATAREQIYIAAVTRCFPGPNKSGRGDRVPSPQEQARCGVWLDAELEIIRPTLVIPVGKLAISRFLPDLPLDRLIGREHSIETAAGTMKVIPLPHPSGASSWVHQGDHPKLLDRALRLLAKRLAEARPRRSSRMNVRSVA